MRSADATETYFLTLLGHFLTGQTPPASPADCDWHRLHDLAHSHRLSPLLAAALPPGTPAAAAGPLQTQARQRRIRTMVMVADYAAIRQSFARANIPLVPLKGIALAHTVYPSPSMRYFDDLDMLIPQDRGPEALAVLADLGYQPHPNAPAPEWHHLPPYVHP
ncbi:MAG: nucleotidyltransferase family protein, partial [Anaerolineales bacterium]|nr:nucleotidyltransferase family protein [Anaerolineales bacterium]